MKQKDDEPKIDESLLTEVQKEELKSKKVNVAFLIFIGVVLLLMIACIVVIFSLKNNTSRATR